MKQYLQGFCDVMSLLGNRTSWDEAVGTCKSYKEKHKQVQREKGITHYCMQVCGNCEHFTVGQVETSENKVGGGNEIKSY